MSPIAAEVPIMGGPGVLALDRVTTSRGADSGDGQHLRRSGATA
ncbi:hypothetical protein [Pseudonocardia sediminis]|nr:hypothetical protein [Pseudonocardia sediminis]